MVTFFKTPLFLLIGMQYLQELFVYLGLSLESVLDFVDIIDGVIEFDGLGRIASRAGSGRPVGYSCAVSGGGNGAQVRLLRHLL